VCRSEEVVGEIKVEMDEWKAFGPNEVRLRRQAVPKSIIAEAA
jgi:hypothetical protein